jgi:hypothetical protein
MKTKLLTFTLAATLSAGLFAIPLSVLVEKESEKIADTIRVFDKDCNKVSDDQSAEGSVCREKHNAIEEALTKFIALAKEEIGYLPDETSADFRAQLEKEKIELHEFNNSPLQMERMKWTKPPPDMDVEGEIKDIKNRRQDMQLQIRWAQHHIRCLDRENAPECKAEKAVLNKETYPFGRVGLMSDKPTHKGEQEEKHWHPVRFDDGTTGEIAVNEPDAVRNSGNNFLPSSHLPPDCVELSPEVKPRDGDYYQLPPPIKPGNVPASYVLTKVYQHGAFLGWCYMDKSAVERLHIAKAQTSP